MSTTPSLTDINGVSIAVVSKASQWRGQQQLQYASIISYIKNDFHGLADFQDQMSTYSSTHPILVAAWNTVVGRVPMNAKVSLQTYYDPILGCVGNAYQTMLGFGSVFAASPVTSAVSNVAKTASQLAPAASIIASAPATLTAPVAAAGVALAAASIGASMPTSTSTPQASSANQISGVPVSGAPTTAGQYLGYTGQQLTWSAPSPVLSITTGAPTTTPTIGTIMLDSSGSKLWVYTNSGWKQSPLTS